MCCERHAATRPDHELESCEAAAQERPLIPGREAPKLWRSEAVAEMKPGSIVVDLAAERGGNCDETVKGEMITTEKNIIGNLVGTWAELTELMALADKGQVHLAVQEYSLANANQALQDLNNGKVKGRAVLIP